MMPPNAKLHVVTRADLSPAQQAVQAMHAVTEYLMQHREAGLHWHQVSNHLALLVVPSEEALEHLTNKAMDLGFRYSEFREPDRKGELTAVALEPEAKRLCRRLPLALAHR